MPAQFHIGAGFAADHLEGRAPRALQQPAEIFFGGAPRPPLLQFELDRSVETGAVTVEGVRDAVVEVVAQRHGVDAVETCVHAVKILERGMKRDPIERRRRTAILNRSAGVPEPPLAPALGVRVERGCAEGKFACDDRCGRFVGDRRRGGELADGSGAARNRRELGREFGDQVGGFPSVGERARGVEVARDAFQRTLQRRIVEREQRAGGLHDALRGRIG